MPVSWHNSEELLVFAASLVTFRPAVNMLRGCKRRRLCRHLIKFLNDVSRSDSSDQHKLSILVVVSPARNVSRPYLACREDNSKGEMPQYNNARCHAQIRCCSMLRYYDGRCGGLCCKRLSTSTNMRGHDVDGFDELRSIRETTQIRGIGGEIGDALEHSIGFR